MAGLEVRDTIESSGYPLCFRVASDKVEHESTAQVGINQPLTIKVEARALGGHQKEAVVTEGEGGPSWRMVSDEGPFLQGTDLAPFPLGFMNAGMQADLLGRLAALARLADTPLKVAESQLSTDYSFEGSFFKGTGKGSARPPEFSFALPAGVNRSNYETLVARAFEASPLIAMHRQSLANTFSLTINGQRRPMQALPASGNFQVVDPLKSWSGVPKPTEQGMPLDQANFNLIERLSVAAGSTSDSVPAPLPGEAAKIDIMVRGRTSLAQYLAVENNEAEKQSDVTAKLQSEVWLARPIGTRFRLCSSEPVAVSKTGPMLALAPRGVSLSMAGIAFCLMTQILRYVEYHKLRLRALRVVQISSFDWSADGDALALPLDTHVFVHADEPAETVERLLKMSAKTCYLHAALGSTLEPFFIVQ
jgi:hypothetical protein